MPRNTGVFVGILIIILGFFFYMCAMNPELTQWLGQAIEVTSLLIIFGICEIFGFAFVFFSLRRKR